MDTVRDHTVHVAGAGTGAIMSPVKPPYLPKTPSAFAKSETRESIAAYVAAVVNDVPSGLARLNDVTAWLTSRCEENRHKQTFVFAMQAARGMLNAIKPRLPWFRDEQYKGKLDPLTKLLLAIARHLLADSSYDSRLVGGQALLSSLLLHIYHPGQHTRLQIFDEPRVEVGLRVVLHAAIEMQIAMSELYVVLLALWGYVRNTVGPGLVELRRKWNDDFADLDKGAGRHVLLACAKASGLPDASALLPSVFSSATCIPRMLQIAREQGPISHDSVVMFTQAASMLPHQMSLLAYVAKVTAASHVLSRPGLETALCDRDTHRIGKLGADFIDQYVQLVVTPFIHPDNIKRQELIAQHLSVLLQSELWDEQQLQQAQLWKHEEWCPALFSHCIEPELLRAADSLLQRVLSGRNRACRIAKKHTGFADAVRKHLGEERVARLMSVPPPSAVESLRQQLRWSGLRSMFIAGQARQVQADKRNHATAASDSIAGTESTDPTSSVAGDDKRRRRSDTDDKDLAF